MPRNRRSRIYWREQGGHRRAYGDFRDIGGGREALIPAGDTRATTDPVIAEDLVAARLRELQEQKRDRQLLGVRRRATLLEYGSEHLRKKAKSARVTPTWLEAEEKHLQVAVEYFGQERDVASIAVEHVQDFAHHLADLPNGRGETLSPSTQRKYLNSLSNLFRRAQGEGLLRGVNPVQALMEKPSGEAAEAAWLEVWEAALLLESARTYPYDAPVVDGTAGRRLDAAIGELLGPSQAARGEFVRRMRDAGKLVTAEKLETYLSGTAQPTRGFLEAAAAVLGVDVDRLARPRGWYRPARPAPIAYPIIATYLLTGARESEVYGLELRDVSFERAIVVFRPTERRRLKTRTSSRVVPLWPQLREILEPHLEERRAAGAGERDLLFPSPVTGGLITDFRKSLDAIAGRVGWDPGEIRTKMFRHSYASARLMTLDNGAPVAIFTVGRELGHGGESLVKKVYGHLGRIRHRSEVVEYRLDQQRDAVPAERLRLLHQVA